MDSSPDTELLCRAAVNHLFLAQYEPFRAILQTLRARNPDLARSVLQTIVAKGGQFDSVQWSSHPSCPSPALLTFLSTLELLQFNDPTSQLWSFDHNTLKLRVEFLLYIQMIVSRVSESVKEARDLDGSEIREKGTEGFDEKGEKVVESEEVRGIEGELDECLRVLDRVGDLGLNRLRPDLIVEDREGESGVGGGEELREEEIMCLRRVVLEHADVFDVLSENIRLQVGWIEEEEVEEELSMAIMLRAEGSRRETEEGKVLKLMQTCFQTVHLDAIKECLEKDDVDGAVSHLRFLHLGYGIEETEYRYVKLVSFSRLNNGVLFFKLMDMVL